MSLEINVASIDKIVLKESQLEKISQAIINFGDLTEHRDNIWAMFEKVLVTIEDDNYDKHNAMLKIISGSKENELQKKAVLFEQKGDSIVSTTGMYKNGSLKVDSKEDTFMKEVGMTALCYLYIVSESRENKTVYDKDLVKEEIQTKEVFTYKKNKAKQLKRKVKIQSKKVYTIEPITEGNKRAYERVLESWNVRGHWREYKNGNRVWINGYKKGNGKVEGKTFEV